MDDKLTKPILQILATNEERNKVINTKFNPITGEGSLGEREKFTLSDFSLPVQYLPKRMMKIPLVKQLQEAGSLKQFLLDIGAEDLEGDKEKLVEQFVRLRIKHDFAFWAATYVYIKNKGGGDDVLFRLNRAQRRLVAHFEKARLAGKPIRIILLKARQWGGSTVTQIYMAWLQLVHKVGLNSLIVGHVKDASTEVKDMFDRLLKAYPLELLHLMGEAYNEKEPKLVGVGNSGNIQRIPQRNCKIKIGTAEKPDSARGGDYNLVHLTEVGLWKKTENKTPADIVRSATSGILLRPFTMIVYESTANGIGNFFHKEYLAAKKKESQFTAVFIAWFEIEQYALPFSSTKEKERFAKWLYENRNNDTVASEREEPGTYLYKLWEKGATLEAIHWYIAERAKYTCHADMASEYPSDDIEAFAFSGIRVFRNEDIETFRPACRPPKYIGDIYGHANEGEEALERLRFEKEENGRLFMWQDVEKDENEIIQDRYLVIVDVCKGHTKTADFADILVIDRLYMIDGEPPTVVAEWHGHIDMDMLAWKATQIAEYYNHALLVIESNTLETNNTKGEAEYILNVIREVYDNLYARKQSAEDIREKRPVKYGFHTNPLTKKAIIHNLKTVIREHLYVEREAECLDEYLTYIETEKGGFEAMEGHHDDRLMTRAIGMWICLYEMDMPVIIQVKKQKQKKHREAVSAATI